MTAYSYSLVPVITADIGDRTVNAVSARELHAYLQVGRDFSTWFKDRVEGYGFVEDEEYSPVLGDMSDGSGTHRVDYLITLGMAKELAMVECTDRGRQIRRYFIACEEKWRMVRPVPGRVDILLETCIKEAGHGNLFAMTVLMTVYGFASDLMERQLDEIASREGRLLEQMPLNGLVSRP